MFMCKILKTNKLNDPSQAYTHTHTHTHYSMNTHSHSRICRRLTNS